MAGSFCANCGLRFEGVSASSTASVTTPEADTDPPPNPVATLAPGTPPTQLAPARQTSSSGPLGRAPDTAPPDRRDGIATFGWVGFVAPLALVFAVAGLAVLVYAADAGVGATLSKGLLVAGLIAGLGVMIVFSRSTEAVRRGLAVALIVLYGLVAVLFFVTGLSLLVYLPFEWVSLVVFLLGAVSLTGLLLVMTSIGATRGRPPINGAVLLSLLLTAAGSLGAVADMHDAFTGGTFPEISGWFGGALLMGALILGLLTFAAYVGNSWTAILVGCLFILIQLQQVSIGRSTAGSWICIALSTAGAATGVLSLWTTGQGPLRWLGVDAEHRPDAPGGVIPARGSWVQPPRTVKLLVGLVIAMIAVAGITSAIEVSTRGSALSDSSNPEQPPQEGTLTGPEAQNRPSSASPSADLNTMSANGVTYKYPANWSERTDLTTQSEQGNRAWQQAVGPDSVNMSILSQYNINIHVTPDNVSGLKSEVESTLSNLARQAGGATTGPLTEESTAGYPGFTQTLTVKNPSGQKVQSTVWMFFKGKTEYFLNCQYLAAQKFEIRNGCNTVRATFTVTG